MRVKRLQRKRIAILVFLVAWALLILSYGNWHCPLFIWTGIRCASCGITTAFMCFLRFDWVGAWRSNPLIFFLIPWSLYVAQLYIQSGIYFLKHLGIWFSLGAALGVMGIFRWLIGSIK